MHSIHHSFQINYSQPVFLTIKQHALFLKQTKVIKKLQKMNTKVDVLILLILVTS